MVRVPGSAGPAPASPAVIWLRASRCAGVTSMRYTVSDPGYPMCPQYSPAEMSPEDLPAAGNGLAGDAVAARIARWHPVSVPPRAAAFAREVVTAAGPGTPDRVKNGRQPASTASP